MGGKAGLGHKVAGGGGQKPNWGHREQGNLSGTLPTTLSLTLPETLVLLTRSRGRVHVWAAGPAGAAHTQDTCQKQASWEPLPHIHASVVLILSSSPQLLPNQAANGTEKTCQELFSGFWGAGGGRDR